MLKSLSGIALALTCFAISAQPATSAQGPEVVRKVRERKEQYERTR